MCRRRRPARSSKCWSAKAAASPRARLLVRSRPRDGAASARRRREHCQRRARRRQRGSPAAARSRGSPAPPPARRRRRAPPTTPSAASRARGRAQHAAAGARRRSGRLHRRLSRRGPGPEGHAGRALGDAGRRVPECRLHSVQGAAARRQGHRGGARDGRARHRVRRAASWISTSCAAGRRAWSRS